MRYFLFLSLLVVTSAAWAINESVSAISYNPSRLGAYTHLKAVESASLLGGLKAEDDSTVNIMSEGMVTISDSLHACNSSSGVCSSIDKIDEIHPIMKEADCDQKSNHCGWSTAQAGGALQGPSGRLYSPTGYNYTSASTNTGLTVNMKGGSRLTATQNSYIGTIQNVGNLSMTISNKAEVNGNVTIKNSFSLGGIAISKPTEAFQRYTFVERVDKNQKKYKVLSIVK